MKKLIAIGAVLALALVLALSFTLPVAATTTDVTTGAEMSGTGIPPVIKAKWEAHDDDPLTPGCQIIPPPSAWDPSTGILTEGVTDIEVWAVVTDEEGIADIMTVQNEVLHPDGSMKWQEVMVEIPITGNPRVIPPFVYDHLAEAVASGQITQALADDIIAELLKGEARIFKYIGQYNTHTQPAGKYEAIVYATDFGGSTSVKIHNNFWIISILAYAIDFDVVNWGFIKPLVTDTVSGNETMDPMTQPAGKNNNPPTIQNLGNDPLSLKLHFTEMVGKVQGKKITQFDATFMGYTIDPITASTWVDWTKAGPGGTAVKLTQCHKSQLDFSIHPPNTITSDSYSGKINITVVDP